MLSTNYLTPPRLWCCERWPMMLDPFSEQAPINAVVEKKYWLVWPCNILRVQGAGWGLKFNDTHGKARQNWFLVSHHQSHVMKPCLLISHYCTHYKSHPLICTWFLSTHVPVVFSDYIFLIVFLILVFFSFFFFSRKNQHEYIVPDWIVSA